MHPNLNCLLLPPPPGSRAEILERMYTRWAHINGFSVHPVDRCASRHWSGTACIVLESAISCVIVNSVGHTASIKYL